MTAALHSSRQRWLPLTGPADHFELLHGKHRANVAVCSRAAVGSWDQRVYAHDDALAVAVNLAAHDDLNVYQSQCGFSGSRRIVAGVAAIPAAFVDLDHYKLDQLARLDAEGLLDLVLDALPWLPVPTLLFNSGRGAYFQWLFTEPLPASRIAEWATVQDVLVELLAPFGADAQAKDAARVLRVVGSVNLRSGERVSGLRDTGAALRFDAFRNVVLREGLVELRRRDAERAAALGHGNGSTDELRRVVHDSARATSAQRAQFIDARRLADARMHDCATIARLRGVPLADCRHRLLWVYSTSAAWFVGNEEQLVAELEAFATDHFADGERYGRRNVGTVLDRLRRDQDGIIGIWAAAGLRVPNRYRLGNPYIIRLLSLSAAEQRELRTIIGKEERQRRRVERRRAAGMVDRQAQAAERVERAVELRQRGLSQAAIAAELGVTQQAVSKMLRQARTPGYN